VGHGVGLVISVEGSNPDRTELGLAAARKLLELDGERPVALLDCVSHGASQVADPRLDPGRAADPQRLGARVFVERREQQQRDSREVIAVEVRDQDRVDLATLDAEVGEPGVGRRAAVEQDAPVRRAQQDGRLSPTTGAEGVAGSDEDHLTHVSSPGHGWKAPLANTPPLACRWAGTVSPSQTTARRRRAPGSSVAPAPMTRSGSKRVPWLWAHASASM
jgi:hypothetical protein